MAQCLKFTTNYILFVSFIAAIIVLMPAILLAPFFIGGTRREFTDNFWWEEDAE